MSKYISKNNENNNSDSKIVTVSLFIFNKYLVLYKTAHAIIKSSLSKKVKNFNLVITKWQLYNDLFISII